VQDLGRALHPERCLHEPHIWTAWGPYIPLLPITPYGLTDGAPKPSKVLAYRERMCGRCGVVEQEDYYGEHRTVVDDPRGIAAALRAKAKGGE
jgi:hypothetical protein